ncbi:hypothetical protein [Rugamonas sp. DEMB1]|uniref:hypothetical protein n=1 Tax=Rugamonas sp. DEMB1 TaxID=3039386 RepID=UPI0024483EAF|nr:hypothetical protein [Rugamonas sp. DEMB1]WGG48942.1 hypothetical protein QC826_20155 [Rugamonas sp. DEMB1]
MDHNKRTAAAAIAQRMLLKQLYMEKFFQDPQARDLMPSAIASNTKATATQAAGVSDPLTSELMALVSEEVEQFFTDVESELQQIEQNQS